MEIIINNIFDKFGFITDFLLKQTVYTLILFTIIFITSFFLRKKSPLWHFGLWMLVLIRLILPADLSLPISARNLVDKVLLINNVIVSMENVTDKLDIDRVWNADLATSNALQVQGNTLTSVEIFNQRVDKYITWPALFALGWITGCLLMIVLVSKKLLKFRRIIKNSSSIQDDTLLAFLLYWRHRLKIRRTVRIVSSDEFLSPFTVGIIRPVIYIPKGFLNSTNADTIHSIIAHEMVHIKRFDDLWIKLQNILQIIYFFNPAVWYANRQISLAREQICDSAVLAKDVISPRSYGNGMLHVLKLNLFGFDLVCSLPYFGSHKKIFKHRIQNIINGGSMKKQKPLFVFLAICLIGFSILPFVSYCKNEKNASNDEIKFSEKNVSDDEIKFEVPINGHITSLFGWRKDPITGERAFHHGIDIAAPIGKPIIAAASGIVSHAKFKELYGNLIILKHSNGYETAYGQCDKILVKEGQAVESGDIIATCGRSGRNTGSHLHFEIRKDGEAINPYPYLTKRIENGRVKNID